MKISQKNRNIGYVYSSLSGYFAFRGKKNIMFESSLERDLLAILEYDPNVIDVIGQPMTIEYVNKNGREVTYTPDFLVHYKSAPSLYNKSFYKTKLIEVKPREILERKWEEHKPKFKVGLSHAKSEGWTFCIYDESRIKAEFLENINLIKRFRNSYFDTDELEKIIFHVKKNSIEIGHLLDNLYMNEDDKKSGHTMVKHLLSKQLLLCDLSTPLNPKTVIWVNDNHDLKGKVYE